MISGVASKSNKDNDGKEALKANIENDGKQISSHHYINVL
jgi:hypothetical protein